MDNSTLMRFYTHTKKGPCELFVVDVRNKRFVHDNTFLYIYAGENIIHCIDTDDLNSLDIELSEDGSTWSKDQLSASSSILTAISDIISRVNR